MSAPEPELHTGYHALSKAEVRRRASAGLFFVASSGLAGLVFSFGGNLVMARLLTPRDFGLVAIGATITLFGGALTEGGLGSGMIRQPISPTASELRALNGLQLALALAICVPGAIIALQFGVGGAVTAAMVMSLPIATLQTPGAVVLTRSMRYDRLAVVSLGALAASQLFAIVAVVLGAGVWGLALSYVVKSAIGTVLIAIASGYLHRPSFRGWSAIWPVMRFGLSFQASWIAVVVGAQGLNATVGGVGGVQELGLWSLASKTLQVPSVLFNSLTSVVFPSISNLLARGEDPSDVVRRAARLTSIAASVVFVPFAAVSPDLIPLLFGERWSRAAQVIPLVVLAALISGPIASVLDGYLFALGRAGGVLRAWTINGIVSLVVAGPLLIPLGIRAIGIGAVAAAIAQVLVLDRESRAAGNIAVIRPLVAPVLISVVAGACGLALCAAEPRTALAALAAGALALGIDLGLFVLATREDLISVLTLGFRSVRDALSGLSRARQARNLPPE